ncbi:hypothetical protein GCM10008927_13930 [Amylibacter ulvae]|uniref:Uncharacterized protein n=1 Tax=Paramylibacter ulvae TaxID=1651968 RepID=A0ABQ3D2J3_9RHOB|nr:hypothetical protein GCM10008927_13930 [Amylibacter ulvae]
MLVLIDPYWASEYYLRLRVNDVNGTPRFAANGKYCDTFAAIFANLGQKEKKAALLRCLLRFWKLWLLAVV